MNDLDFNIDQLKGFIENRKRLIEKDLLYVASAECGLRTLMTERENSIIIVMKAIE